MHHRGSSYPVAVLLLCAGALAFGEGGGNGNQDSQSCLVRPDDNAPDDNAKGTVRIRSKGNNSERFDVHAIKVDKDEEHHLWIEDPLDSDTFTDLGDLPGDGGSQKLALDTKKGDTLPLGVTSVEELIGRRIEVRHGDDVELEGDVPPFGLDKKSKKEKVTLDAEPDDPQPDVTATLEMRSKENKGQERIILTVKKIDFDDGPFDVWVEDGAATNVFVNEGDLEQLSEHKGRYRRDCQKGQALPGDVMFVGELEGRRIQVRDGDDVVYLEGTIPSLEQGGGPP